LLVHRLNAIAPGSIADRNTPRVPGSRV
jgi:hypothetical protein